MTCPHCAATARPGASFCGQCHETLGRVEVPARFVPRAEERVLPTYSRWRSTATTFGPVGRVVWTLAMVLVAAMSVFSQNPFAIGPLCFLGVPLVMRSVWAKGRVR